jgi:hypothetical protein
MAGTIAVDISVNGNNGVWTFPFSRSFTVVQTNPGSHDPLHYLTETPEVISLGELVSPGMVVLFNIGGSVIAFGPQSGGNMVPFGKLSAGEAAVFRYYPGMVLMAAAIMGTSAVWPIIFEG